MWKNIPNSRKLDFSRCVGNWLQEVARERESKRAGNKTLCEGFRF